MKNKEEDNDKISNLWGAKASEDNIKRANISWMDYPLIQQEYINKKFLGGHNKNWLDYVKEKYIGNILNNGLTLGCGSGGLERHALAISICKNFDAFDISKQAIEIAINLSIQSGVADCIKYQIKDINEITLLESHYDVAFASMSAHHFSNLENVFEQTANSLTKNSYFILNEYVGPNQFQWDDFQIRLANDILKILPINYREYVNEKGNFKDKVERPTIEYMNSIDPSEAIRSSDIIKELEKKFEIIEIIGYGGTILELILNGIMGNFDSNSIRDTALIRLICYLEETLIDNKSLTSDFVLIVSKKL